MSELSYKLSLELEKRGYKDKKALGYLDAIQDLQKIDEQPQLNDNQQTLLVWMQENECYTDDPLESISDLFLEGTPSEYFPDVPLSCVEAAYQSLTNQQKVEMVSEYLRQHLEKEE